MSSSINEQVSQIAGTARDLPGFYDGFLKYVAGQTNATSGVVWSYTPEGPKPVCQVLSKKQDAIKLAISEREHTALIQKLSDNDNNSMLVFPKENPDPAGEAHPVLLMAMVRRGGAKELVELFLESGASDEVYKEQLSRVQSCCSAASGAIAQRELESNRQTNSQHAKQSVESESNARNQNGLKLSVSDVDGFAHQLHLSLDPTETAHRIANETRRILDCDRVSVIRMKGRRSRIVAVSGQPSVNRRSNTVQMLQRLVQKVLPTKQTFWYPGSNEQQIPPQIERPLNEHMSQSSARTIAIYPFFDQPPQGDQERSPDDEPRKSRLIGGIVVEQLASQWEELAVRPSVDLVARHSENAFRAAHNHGQLFGYPVWKWLGKSRVLTTARNLPKTIAALIAVAVLAAVLALVPGDFSISCDGQILPQRRSNIFTRLDGVVDQINVSHGSEVNQSDTLMTLANQDLLYQQQDLQGQIDSLKDRINYAEDLRSTASSEEELQLAEQNLTGMQATLKSTELQLETLKEKSQSLEVKSPINGSVISWGLKDRLKDRPVTAGDVLFEIADINGPWILELELKDRHIGHVLKAMRESEEPLKVEFQLAADPNNSYTGRVIEVGNATAMSADQQQVALLKVAIDDLSKLDVRQARSTVSAKIYCGQRKLGFVWLHDPWEFLQRQWFRIW